MVESTIPKELSKEPRGRVMVVDDEPEMATLISCVIVMAGYNPQIVVPRSALAEFRANPSAYSLVCTDKDLRNGTNGVELIGQMMQATSEAGDRQKTPARFMLLTAGIVTEEEQEFLQENSVTFVEKPFDISELSETIARLLGE